MIRQKCSKIRKIKASLQDLLVPLTGKPALTCAIVLMAVYAALDCPEFALVLLLPVAACIRFFPKSVQWAIFFTLLIGVASHTLWDGDLHTRFESHTPATKEPPATLEPPATDCGNIEAVLPRANGVAFIVQVASAQISNSVQLKVPDSASLKTSDSALLKTSDPMQPPSRPYRVRLTEKRELAQMPLPGDSICYEASWYPITPPTVPGAFDTRNWLKSQKLRAYGKFKHWDSWRGNWIPERSFYAFRMWIKSRFDEYLDPAETGLLLGLLAGDKSGIPEALRSDFQRSGLVHVLAISGFHVVLLAGMLMVFLKATGLPHRIVRIVAVILLFIYIPITGGSAAVRRAVLMFAVPQIGTLFQKPANTMNSLGVALLFILFPEPEQIWNPGFQLSVAATVGILIGGGHNPLKNLPEALQKNKIWSKFQELILDPTYVTLCATLATAPFLIHHFKTLSPFAWLGNIIVVPAISWGMQAGLFALLSPIDFFRQHFCYAAGFFLRVASLLTRLLSDSTEASITVGPFGPAILLILGAAFLFLPICRKNAIARAYSFACILLFSFLFCIGAYSHVIWPSWQLTIIDIGQGDSILLTSPSGKNFLIDAGPNDKQDSGKDIIVPYLHHIGVLQLDALIITHPDADHFGGAESIITSFPVKEVWTTECARTEPKEEWLNTLAEASGRDIPIRDIRRGFTWSESNFEIRAVHPQPIGCGETNEGSITLRVKGLGHSAVLTGDLTTAGEKEIMRNGAYLKSDVLKLGHHGSKTSSGRPFLEAVAPQIALISSGRHNRFRHPSKQIINRLDSLHIPYLNTAEKGTITLQFTPDTLLVHTMLK